MTLGAAIHLAIAILLLLSGLASLPTAVITLVRRVRRLSRSVRVVGTIKGFTTMDNEGQTSYAPIVEFVAPDGRTIEHRATVCSPKPDGPLGTRIALRCPTDAPEHAVIDDFRDKYLLPITFFLVAAFLIGWTVSEFVSSESLLEGAEPQ